MNETFRRITHDDSEWHERFFAFAENAFRAGNIFRRWTELGGWHPGYEVFAIERNGEILSTAGREQMQLVIDGKETSGYQLGAVATRSDCRNQGLSRRLLCRLLAEEEAPKLPVILFANPRVLDFYPRFGFARILQRRFTATVTIEPAPPPAPTLDMDEPHDRARLADLCRRARAPGTVLSARDYFPTLLWHLLYKPMPVFWLDEMDAALVASVADDRLFLHDVIAARAFDLTPILPRLIPNRVRSLEFGFAPETWWPTAHPSSGADMDTHFFVRNLPPLATEAFRFPDLTQT